MSIDPRQLHGRGTLAAQAKRRIERRVSEARRRMVADCLHFLHAVEIVSFLLYALNFAVKWITTAMLSLLLCSDARAEFQVMAAAKLQAIKSLLPPTTNDKDVDAALKSPATFWYTEEEITPASQKWDSGIMGVMDVRFDFNGPQADPTGNPNRDFPWQFAGGAARAQGFAGVKFVSLPRDKAGDPLPIVVYRTRLPGDSQDGISWLFPVGAIVGEVLFMQGDGSAACFEIRTRTRSASKGWEPDSFVPYPTSQDFAAALKAIGRPELAKQFDVAKKPLPIFSAVDNLPLRHVFRQSTARDTIPGMTPQLFAKLMRGVPFHSRSGQYWLISADGFSCYQPYTESPLSLVPPRFDGFHVAAENISCARCHVTVQHHAEEFADSPRQRDWYSRIRGSDGIFSFHPFDPASVNNSARPRQVVFRKAFFDAGLCAMYDSALHAPADYVQLREYDPALDLPSFNNSR